MSVADWRDRFKRSDPRRRLDTQPGSGDQQTLYGFRWGPFELMRTAQVPRGGTAVRVVSLVTDAGHLLEAYVSGRGRSVRVWLDHRELKVPGEDVRVRCAPDDWICSVCDGQHVLFKGRWTHSCEGQPSERGGVGA
jgi:hypothetical protein